MKYGMIGIALFAAMLSVDLSPGHAQELAGAAPTAEGQTRNPLEIALLKWYGANLTTSFAVGTEPRGVCFDGANIWVANYGSNTVTKLQSNDGAVLGTFVVGTEPANVAFDGANIWVTNFGSNNVTKLRASDGTVLGTFPAGPTPFGRGRAIEQQHGQPHARPGHLLHFWPDHGEDLLNLPVASLPI